MARMLHKTISFSRLIRSIAILHVPCFVLANMYNVFPYTCTIMQYKEEDIVFPFFARFLVISVA